MSKETTVVVLGIFVVILPFLGFPESWRVVMYVVSGFGIMIMGFMLRADHLRRSTQGSVPTRPMGRKVSDIVPQAHEESTLVQ